MSLLNQSVQSNKFQNLKTEGFATAILWKSRAGLKFWSPVAERYFLLIQLMPQLPLITWPVFVTNAGCSTPVPIPSTAFESHFHSAQGQTNFRHTSLKKNHKALHLLATLNCRSSHTASVPHRSRRQTQDTAFLSGYWHLRLVSPDVYKGNKGTEKSRVLLITALKSDEATLILELFHNWNH